MSQWSFNQKASPVPDTIFTTNSILLRIGSAILLALIIVLVLHTHLKQYPTNSSIDAWIIPFQSYPSRTVWYLLVQRRRALPSREFKDAGSVSLRSLLVASSWWGAELRSLKAPYIDRSNQHTKLPLTGLLGTDVGSNCGSVRICKPCWLKSIEAQTSCLRVHMFRWALLGLLALAHGEESLEELVPESWSV